PPVPSNSTETSNIVISAAPRSPARSFLRFFERGSMTGLGSLVINRIAQNYIRGQLHLSGRLVTACIWSTHSGQCHADGDHHKLGRTRRDFAFRSAGRVNHIRNVANAIAVDG